MQQEPLRVEMEGLEALNLEEFPVVGDFVVELSYSGSETLLSFQAPSVDMSVSFPWWNHGLDEMISWSPVNFPCGSLREPFWDRDQGWSLLIWLVGDRVYIAEGDGEEDVYERWFAVPLDRYRSEWRRAIAKLSESAPG